MSAFLSGTSRYGCDDFIGGQLQRARQMVLPVVRLGQYLEEKELVAPFYLQAQFFT